MKKNIQKSIEFFRLNNSKTLFELGILAGKKKLWKNEDTSDHWKINNLKEAKNRLSSWQLTAFEKSYNLKIETGLSLIKKKLLEEKSKN